MRIHKQRILDHLRNLGYDDLAARAAAELPEQVDLDADAQRLREFGIDPSGAAPRPARAPIPAGFRVRLAELLSRHPSRVEARGASSGRDL